MFFARLRRCDSGAAAIEFAFVGLIAILLFLGIIEFGRGLYMKNEMSYAADRAARKILTNAAVTNDEVETVVREAIAFGTPANLQITFGTETVEGVDFRTLLIGYPINLLIPGLTTGNLMLTVDRRVPLG